MKYFIENCYYDGMSVKQATELAKSCYGIEPSKKLVEKIITDIKRFSGKDWK